mgnify:CR=1 FL=1
MQTKLKLFNYYSILADPEHRWLNDEYSLFRCYEHGIYPFISFKFRNYRIRSSHLQGAQRLLTPVAENPYLYLPDKRNVRCGMPMGLKTPKDKFNYAMERMIKSWHRHAKELGCDHFRPYVRMEDDSLVNLFPRF